MISPDAKSKIYWIELEEQALLGLHLLAAAEAREFLTESIANGYNSRGFQLYARLAGTGLGETGEAYRSYLFSLFDEFALDLRVLFDRFFPMGRLFPSETALKDRCRYLVRRPTEVFLQSSAAPELSAVEGNLSQEELLKQPVYIPYRQLKDPREIRMLDPACGSMHFGLYAFDLYECIYEEAWDLEERGVQLQRHSGNDSLMKTYANKEVFLRDVPRSIIEHNIHGVDIDPRAVQIAGLSLWLRSQKSWQMQGLKPSERPQIQKSNIVCAEPMPGEERLLDEFLTQHLTDMPEQRLIGRLVRRVFEAMKLAGEAGSLLQIEQEISKDIEEAKLQWLNRPQSEQLALLTLGTETQQQELPLLIDEITDELFWERVERETYKALNRYAEQADLSPQGGNRYQRRLFANDAVRGFALIDLCQKRFDVALMNPPFGAGSMQTKAKLELTYPRTKNDMYGAFVERGLQLLGQRRQLGAITSRTGFFLSSFQKWREEILLKEAQPTVFADLGYGVLDAAMVETAAYCLSKEVA